MPDAAHYFSGDLIVSATGDLLVATDLDESNQRILRRLNTNPADYIWEPDYGAGLPRKIGGTLDEPELQALIQSQMYMEQSVSQNPSPQISTTAIANGFQVNIGYVENNSNQPQTLSFQVTP